MRLGEILARMCEMPDDIVAADTVDDLDDDQLDSAITRLREVVNRQEIA
jgi:hypothetical protein